MTIDQELAVAESRLDLYGRVDEAPPHTRCRAIKPGGERCGQFSNLSAGGLCLWHDPDRAAEALDVRRRGGTRAQEVQAEQRGTCPAPTSEIRTLEDVADHMAWAVRAMEVGAIDEKTGRSVVYSLDRLRATLRDKDLERQFKKLQRELAALKKAS